MNRNKIMTVTDDILKIFVANIGSSRDINFTVNVDKIKKQNYHCGILLNQKGNSIFEDNSLIPLYTTEDPLDFYTLDITHKPDKFVQKKYRFIYININSLARGIFNEDYIIDDINTLSNEQVVKRTDYNNSVEISILKKNISFNEWLEKKLEEGKQMDKIFVVTNDTPFYYVKSIPNNFYINSLIITLIKYAHTKLIYISTDSDHYQNIMMYDSSIPVTRGRTKDPVNESLSINLHLNLLMVGTLGAPKRIPSIFIHPIYDAFYGKLGYISNRCQTENASGYLEIIIDNKEKKISYITPNRNDIIKFIVHQMIRLIHQSKNKTLTAEEINLLEVYKSTVESNNYLSYYKSLTYSKRSSINVRRWIFINKILPETTKIIENYL